MIARKALAAASTVLLGLLAVVVLATPAAADPLKVHAAARGKYMGDAVDNSEITDATYRTHIANEFNMITPGNAMKWDATEPSQGQFSYARADEIMNLATTNGQQVRGHTLVWHSQTPSWVQNLDATSLRTALNNHIANVAGHYKGRLYAWDVVNEPLNEDGTMRNSFWFQKLGTSYIADAFRAARAADPTAKLYINDYNTDGLGAKSDGMFALVQSLLSQGVPIDGVGFQAHLAIQFGFPNQMQQNLQRFANLGLDVAITELDVRMQLPSDATKLATQATYYRNVMNACLAVTRCVGVTTWGYTDKYSWVPSTFPGEGAALLVDANFAVKPAYTAVHDALAGGSSTDTTPPTTPGTPTSSNVTSSGAALSWTASTDTGGSGLAGYNVYRTPGDTLLAQSTTNAVTLAGLTPSTAYQVYVRARDGAGNLSTASASATFTTQAGTGGGGACRVAYTASNWGGGGGFTGGVTITNTSTVATNGWTLAFTFPSGQRVSQGWNATWAQATGSANVTATSMSYNGTLAPGTSTQIGFNGTFTTTNTAPSTFTLNTATCTTA